MKTMLITGASKGIGAATAKLAAEQGYAIALNYKSDEQSAANTAREIRSEGGRVELFSADVSDEKAIIQLVAAVINKMGRIDVLVNNAGILETQTEFLEIDTDRIQRIFQTNVFGPMILSREVAKHMSTKMGGKGGTIVNVSSLAAKSGAPFEYVDYAASKGAIDSFTIGLAKELAVQGIRVNAVRPAFIHTGIHALGGMPDRIERYKNSIPLQRGGMPEEVAEAILFFAGEQSSYCTGNFLDVSGGK